MKTWYQNMKAKLQITGTGIVAEFLKAILENGLMEALPQVQKLDANVSGDVISWFTGKFNPWFAQLSASLEVGNSVNELSAVSYTNSINAVIKSLWVAKSFYAKQATSEYVTSLKNVALYKASLCEELAKAVDLSYQEALRQFGSEIEGKQTITTIASTYKGSTPENFNWNGDVLVNHPMYEDVSVSGTAVSGNVQDPQNNTCNNRKRDLVPWVFTAAFGLIAWSAAAKDSSKASKK